MFIVPRGKVRVQLAFVIMVTIILSWVISTGIANYFSYLSLRSLRQEMMKHPDIYTGPLPEPRFSALDFLIGRPPMFRHRRGPGALPPPPMGAGLRQPPASTLSKQGPVRMPPRPSFVQFELKWIALRLAVALGLAAIAAVWLGRRFTNPLMQLAKGADAFQSGNFDYRIPAYGKSEFTAVADAMNEMARQVSRHISELEDDAERRRRFMADIAHELRSPVTTMRTMAGALQDGVAEEPERKERAVNALVRTSERLLRLVQDLMELAKLDLNELPLNVKETDLRELAGSVIHACEAGAAAAGVTLHPLKAGEPVMIVVDPDRIIQVFDNVIGNAISYAGEGASVDITVEDGDPVRVYVRDTGRGISSKDLPYIFDSFYRVDAARTPGECHSGLGLSIARRLIEAHGGQLTVSSEEGKGTLVEISIPKSL